MLEASVAETLDARRSYSRWRSTGISQTFVAFSENKDAPSELKISKLASRGLPSLCRFLDNSPDERFFYCWRRRTRVGLFTNWREPSAGILAERHQSKMLTRSPKIIALTLRSVLKHVVKGQKTERRALSKPRRMFKFQVTRKQHCVLLVLSSCFLFLYSRTHRHPRGQQ